MEDIVHDLSGLQLQHIGLALGERVGPGAVLFEVERAVLALEQRIGAGRVGGLCLRDAKELRTGPVLVVEDLAYAH
jgi:hypothetical protein